MLNSQHCAQSSARTETINNGIFLSLQNGMKVVNQLMVVENIGDEYFL